MASKEKMSASTYSHKSGGDHGDFDHRRRIRGSEVFVGGLHRKTTEENLREFFKEIGDIVDVRLMKDGTGLSKGYGFVRFKTKEAALKAQKKKNGSMLQGKRVGVSPSSDQDTLFLGNLRKEWGRKELESMVREAFEEVESVELAIPLSTANSATNKKQKNRGFAFVHFMTHAAAARAFRIASKPEFMLGGKWRPAVDWAETESDPDPAQMAKVKTAFVGNLPSCVSEDFLRKIFEPYGKIERIAISRRTDVPVGFVHFVQRSHVEAAIKSLDGKLHDSPDGGQKFLLQVTLAKPADKNRKRAREETENPNGSSTLAAVPSAGGLAVYQAPAVPYGDYVLSKNSLAEDPFSLSMYSLPTSVTNQLQNMLRSGVATRYEIQGRALELLGGLPEVPPISSQEQVYKEALGRVRALEYGQLTGSQASAKEGQILSLNSAPTSRLSALDTSEHLVLANRPMDSNLLGYDTYGKYSMSTVAPLSSQSNGILGEQPLLSRLSSGVPVTYGLSSCTSPPSIGALETGRSTNALTGRPFKFDPYTGKPYSYDPFTGAPLQPSNLVSLQLPNYSLMQSPTLAAIQLRGNCY